MHFVSSLPQKNAKSRWKKTDFRSGWKEISHLNRKPMQFTGSSGPAGDFSGLSVVQVFQLFFCSAVWDLLVDETNRLRRANCFRNLLDPTHSNEMMAFVALLLAMGINKSPQYSMYWSTSKVLRMSFYPSIMSRNRFISIMRFFHLSDNRFPEQPLDVTSLRKLGLC